MFKTEMHCHTMESSPCGQVAGKNVAKAYIYGGYSTLVITDHFTSRKGENFETHLNRFLAGFREVKSAANGKLNVILGMELRLSANINDYLVYGVTEEFIRNNPEICSLSLLDFCELAHKNGLLVFQAHPFRNGMTVTDPTPLDGIEAYNGHTGHNSRNSMANAWAELNKKRKTSGSDAHETPHFCRGGILTENEIKNSDDLIFALSSDNYGLITADKDLH